jgi:serine/threonine protein kinase
MEELARIIQRTPHQDRIGQQLDQYRLLRFLGTGTFGDVYLGEHIAEKTTVAVKILRAQPATEHNFLRDARTFRLRHPYIVPLLDFGVEANTPFLVMEYAPDGTLLQRHPQGSRVPLAQVRTYVHQLASALHYAHEMWLLHEAVKPQNMLLSATGEVLLSDLGTVTIARSLHMLSTQEMAASMPYMAPEQIQGQPSPASDQYALGMIIYEWLSGEHPFPGPSWEVSLQHVATVPPPLHTKVADLSPDLEAVIMKALAKDPQERFPDMLTFATAFTQASQHGSISTTGRHRISSKYRALRASAKHKAVSGKSSHLPAMPDKPANAKSPRPLHRARLANISAATPNIPSTPSVSQPSTSTTTAIEATTTTTPPAVQHAISQDQSQPLPDLIPEKPLSSHPTPTARIPRVIPPGAPLIALPDLEPEPGVVSGRTSDTGEYSLRALFSQAVRTRRRIALGLALITLIIVSCVLFYPTVSTGFMAIPATETSLSQSSSNITATTNTSTAPTRTEAMFGLDAGHTNWNTSEKTIGTRNISTLVPLWNYATGQDITASPTVARGLVYIGSRDGIFYAFAASCRQACQPLWSYHAAGAITSSAAVAGGMVYIGADDHTLYAFSALCQQDCQPLWSYKTGGAISASPTFANGTVYVGSADGKLYAFDAGCRSKCQPLWSYHTGSAINSSPAVANGIVYVGSNDHKLYAFNAICQSPCQPLWSYATGASILSSPAVANGVVYVGSNDHKLYAFDATCHSACQPLWSYTTGNTITASPAVANKVVYIGSNDGSLYAFDATCRSACQPLWSASIGQAIASSPTVANGIIYVGSNNHKISAFTTSCQQSCRAIWSYTTGGNVTSSPTVANGVVYVGSSDDRVYAFGLPT